MLENFGKQPGEGDHRRGERARQRRSSGLRRYRLTQFQTQTIERKVAERRLSPLLHVPSLPADPHDLVRGDEGERHAERVLHWDVLRQWRLLWHRLNVWDV